MYKLKKSCLILFFSFFIFSSKIFSMGFPGQRSRLHQDFIDNVTLSSWTSDAEINTHQFLEISHAFIDMMTEWSNNDFLWFNNEIPKDNKIDYIFRNYSFYEVCDRRDGKKFLEFDYLLNYIAKWILNPKDKVKFLGDIHGNFYTIKEILLDMRKNEFIDEDMHLASDRILVFLGDYIDRGGFSLKVFATAMLLIIKNPGRGFLQRGNHEDIHIAYGTNSYGFASEIQRIESDDFFRISIVNNIAKAFEFLSAALFIGYRQEDKIKYQLCAHAGPDIRLKYREFLQTLPYDRSNGVCLKEVSRDDFLSHSEFKKLIAGYIKMVSSEGIDDFLASIIFDNKDIKANYNHPCPIIGLLWNDIYFYGDVDKFINSSGRGEGLIRIHYNFIRYFFNKVSEFSNFEVVGINRGHEHHLPKYISQLEQGLSEIPYPFCTPAIGTIFSSEGSSYYKLLQYGAANIFLSNNFVVNTLISGCIVGECLINYNPTYLEMGYLGDDHWLFTPHECPPKYQNSGRLDLDL